MARVFGDDSDSLTLFIPTIIHFVLFVEFFFCFLERDERVSAITWHNRVHLLVLPNQIFFIRIYFYIRDGEGGGLTTDLLEVVEILLSQIMFMFLFLIIAFRHWTKEGKERQTDRQREMKNGFIILMPAYASDAKCS